MKLIFAGAEKSLFKGILEEAGVKSILQSFFYCDEKTDLKGDKEKFDYIFLDSGGYSARQHGTFVDVEKYGQFLADNKDYISTAANLDVMDLKIAGENQKYLEQFYPVLPVYHYSEYASDKRDMLEYFCKNYKHFAIGGIANVGIEEKLKINYLNYCFKTIDVLHSKIKIHGFGINSPKLLMNYPFYSADSTTWLTGGQFGVMMIWDSKKFSLKTNIHYTDKENMTAGNINVDSIDNYKERLKHNIRELLKMEQDISRMWKVRGVSWEE